MSTNSDVRYLKCLLEQNNTSVYNFTPIIKYSKRIH